MQGKYFLKKGLAFKGPPVGGFPPHLAQSLSARKNQDSLVAKYIHGICIQTPFIQEITSTYYKPGPVLAGGTAMNKIALVCSGETENLAGRRGREHAVILSLVSVT